MNRPLPEILNDIVNGERYQWMRDVDGFSSHTMITPLEIEALWQEAREHPEWKALIRFTVHDGIGSSNPVLQGPSDAGHLIVMWGHYQERRRTGR